GDLSSLHRVRALEPAFTDNDLIASAEVDVVPNKHTSPEHASLDDESRYVVEPRRSITETARWGIVPLDGEVPDRDAATTGTVSVRPSGISTRQGDAVDSVGGLGERRAVSFDGDSIGQDNRRLDGVRRARSEVENAAPCIRRGGVQSRRVIRDAVAYRAV